MESLCGSAFISGGWDLFQMKNTDRICYIFAAGDLYQDAVEIPAGALVIAADGGLYHTARLGIRTDVFLGDFDSANRADAGADCVVYPSEKDYTDSFLAVEYGIRQGCTVFEIYGAFGGKRLDHTVANLQMLEHFAALGYTLRLHGDGQLVTAVSNMPEKSGKQSVSLHFSQEMHGYLSLFAIGGSVTGVTLRGLKYPLTDATLTTDFPLGVSNEFCGKPSEVCFSGGTLMMMWDETKDS